jgi:taurine-pyruvate aminotransferase
VALKAPSIGEVRGYGLLAGLEMVSDGNRTPMPEAQVVQIQKKIREAGVIVGRNNDTVPGLCNVLTLAPPLTLTTEGADTIVGAIERAVGF